MIEFILKWVPIIAGIATVGGLILIFRQLKHSEQQAKITRSNQLIDVYHTHYAPISDEKNIEDISTSPFVMPVVSGADPFLKQPSDVIDKMKHLYKTNRYIFFYVILGVYWYHDLIDKALIKKLIPIELDYDIYEEDREKIIKDGKAKDVFIYWDLMVNEIRNPVHKYNFNDEVEKLRQAKNLDLI